MLKSLEALLPGDLDEQILNPIWDFMIKSFAEVFWGLANWWILPGGGVAFGTVSPKGDTTFSFCLRDKAVPDAQHVNYTLEMTDN